MSSLAQRVVGKYHALKLFVQFVAHFKNWRAAFSCLRRGQVLPPLELRRGITIVHAAGDDVLATYRELFVEKVYTEPWFYQPRPEHTVIDLGANIGMFALFLQAQALGIRVHSFEPASTTRATLTQNIERNGLAKWVTIHREAVAGENGQAVFKTSPEKSVAQSLHANCMLGQDVIEESVETVTLERVLERCTCHAPELLKIDIEGAEVEVLKQTPLAVWQRIPRVVLEFHENFRPGCRAPIVARLREAGFPNIRERTFPPDHKLGLIYAWR